MYGLQIPCAHTFYKEWCVIQGGSKRTERFHIQISRITAEI